MINNLGRSLASGLGTQAADRRVNVSRSVYMRPLFSRSNETHYSLAESARNLSANIKSARRTLQAWAEGGPKKEISARSSLVKKLFDNKIHDGQKPKMEGTRIILPESITLHAPLISALPANMVVEGDLTLDGWENLQAIPEQLRVKGDLNVIGGEKLTGLTVMVLGGNLTLRDCCKIESIPPWITSDLPANSRHRGGGLAEVRTVAFIDTELSQGAHEQIEAGQIVRVERGDEPLHYFIDSEQDEVSRPQGLTTSLRSPFSMSGGRGRTTEATSQVDIVMPPFNRRVGIFEDNAATRSNKSASLKQDIKQAKRTLTNWASNGPKSEMSDRCKLVGQLFNERVPPQQQPRILAGEILIPNTITLRTGLISELPSYMKVFGKLRLIDCGKLASIPRGLSVSGNLDIINAPELKNFRAMKELGGNILISRVPLMERIPESLLNLPANIVERGSVAPRLVHIEYTELSDEANNQIEEYINDRRNNSRPALNFSTDTIRARNEEIDKENEDLKPRGDEPQYKDLPEYKLTEAERMNVDPRCVLSQEDTINLDNPVIVNEEHPQTVVEYGNLLQFHRRGQECPVSQGTVPMEIKLEDVRRVDKSLLC